MVSRGGHSHRRCSHSCDQGQKLLTIVFVAWPLDCTANRTLTIWPHTLDYTRCNTLAQNLNILTAVTEFENCPWLLDRHQKQPLPSWPLLDPSRSCDYSAYGNDHPLWCAWSENIWALGECAEVQPGYFCISLSQNVWLLRSKLQSTTFVPSENM